MKICTACSAAYSDDTLIFCPVDGTTLTPEKKISLEQVPFSYETGSWSEAGEAGEKSEPADYAANFELPPTLASSFSQPPPSAPQNFSSAPRSNPKRGSVFPIVIGGAIILAIAGILLVITSSNSGGTRSYPEVRVTSGNTVAVRVANVSSTNATVANTTASANTAPASNSSTVVTGKPLSRKTDFTGIWKGKFNESPATLSITTQNGETFSGTLSKNGYVVMLTGKVNFEKGTVALTETEVLQTPANSKWNLGTNEGTISEGGKSMSGTGRDKNSSYPWSFTRN